jgi:hypothetical protein
MTTTCTHDARQLPTSLTGLAQPIPSRVSGGDSDAPPRRARPFWWHVGISAWHPHRNAHNHGYVDIALPGGLRLHDLRVVELQTGKLGIVPPRRCMFRGSELVCDADGEPITHPTLSFATPDERHAFGAAVIAAIREAYPDALPGDPPPPSDAQASTFPRTNLHAVQPPPSAPQNRTDWMAA